MKIASQINIGWTRYVVALLLTCLMFSVGAMAQTDANMPLDDEAVAALVDELKDGLSDVIEDPQLTAITTKWDARKDLSGKTKAAILNLLFADVKSVVKDKETQDKVWASWAEDNGENSEPEPAATPTTKQPIAQNCVSGTVVGPDGSCVPKARAQTTDFSGTWILNKTTSKLNDQFDMAPNDITVVQGSNDLVIERHSRFQDREFTVKDKFTLDGKESINPGWQDSQKSSTAVWSDDKTSLIITSRVPMGDNGDMTIVEVYRLKDGHLIIETRSSSSFGEKSDVLVFDKK